MAENASETFSLARLVYDQTQTWDSKISKNKLAELSVRALFYLRLGSFSSTTYSTVSSASLKPACASAL